MPAFSDSPSTDRRLAAAAAAVIALGLLVRAVNHDESQYVAAIALMRTGLPYRDFAYLQTPLQPLLLSPLSLLQAGWLLLGARIANGLFGLATVLLLYFGLKPFASRRARFLACAALTCTDAFLLASSLARNDALPMGLSAAAVVLLLRGHAAKSARLVGLAGLAFGLAASAKLNAAIPAAAAGLFLLVRRTDAARLGAFTAGGLIGLLPVAVMAALAPAQFRFDVFTYNVMAPLQWWAMVGRPGDIEPVHRLLKLAGFAALGAIIPALVAAVLDRRRGDERLLLDMMIGGGLLAAYLPVPFFTQYLVPLLAPLFARFAIAIDALSSKWRKRVPLLTALGCVAGLVNSFGVRFSLFEALRTAPLAGQVARLANAGPVVTLSAERIAGRGVVLDPRFAAGPFLFRTYGQLGRHAETLGKAVPIDRVGENLASRPPALVLVGGEGQPWPGLPHGLDSPLARWALANGYRQVGLGGGFTAYVIAPPGASPR